MNKFKIAMNKTGKFLRKNIYYVLIVVCIAAIGTMVFVSLNNQEPDAPVVNPDPVDPVDPTPVDPTPVDPTPVDPTPVDKPIVFTAPVSGGTIGQNFDSEELVFNTTLKQWSVHQAIDYFGDEGTEVVAAYAGKVTKVGYDEEMGYYVVIEHKDNVSTRYCSLSEEITVAEGQTVQQGQKLGTIGTSMIFEASSGAHLHFETLLNGEIVNPNSYFPAEEK